MSLFDDPDVGKVPEPTYSVTELADAIGRALRASFRDEVWVQGEIRDLSRPQSGHVYFTLCDPAAPNPGATMRVMLSAGNKPAINRTLTAAGDAVRMTAGTQVRIRGRLDWYSPRGELQLRMTAIDPAFTLGQLEVARAELLRRLDEEGLLRANAALALPLVPLRVGLVTSEGSAAEADFLEELRASGFAFAVLRASALVQGADAARSVAAAIRVLGTHRPDVIAVVRGGGSRTDLAAFDDEAVARAIARCPVPVLTGVGHEIDTSVADEVAHTVAKTPTACAQVLVGQVGATWSALEGTWVTIARHARREVAAHDERTHHHAVVLRRAATHALAMRTGRLDAIAHRASRGALVGLASAERRLDALQPRLQRAATDGLEDAEHGLAVRSGRVAGAARSHLRAAEVLFASHERRVAHRAPRALGEHERALDAVDARLRALDPERTLARGWSITRRADGSVVRSPDEVAVGEELATLVAGGEVRSTVTAASTVSDDG